MIIGLTGKRNVGKSQAAGFLVEVGFVRAHPFTGGKIASIAYFEHLGASRDEAERMVFSDLKDQPSEYLPGRSTPRFWMERLGRFMGVDMGPDWTLGAELAAITRTDPGADIVAESIVYEAPQLRAAGGIIVRITRPGHHGPTGENTDKAEAGINADVEIVNDGSLEDLRRQIEEVVRYVT